MATASVSWLEIGPRATASVSWLEVSPGVGVYTLAAGAGQYEMLWAPGVGVVALTAEAGTCSMVGMDAELGASSFKLVAEPAAYQMTGQEAALIPRAVGGSDASAVWEHVLPGGLTPAQLLSELHKIHGLTPGQPLAVTSATRTAGDVSQSISDSAGVVTVTRQ